MVFGRSSFYGSGAKPCVNALRFAISNYLCCWNKKEYYYVIIISSSRFGRLYASTYDS